MKFERIVKDCRPCGCAQNSRARIQGCLRDRRRGRMRESAEPARSRGLDMGFCMYRARGHDVWKFSLSGSTPIQCARSQRPPCNRRPCREVDLATNLLPKGLIGLIRGRKGTERGSGEKPGIVQNPESLRKGVYAILQNLWLFIAGPLFAPGALRCRGRVPRDLRPSREGAGRGLLLRALPFPRRGKLLKSPTPPEIPLGKSKISGNPTPAAKGGPCSKRPNFVRRVYHFLPNPRPSAKPLAFRHFSHFSAPFRSPKRPISLLGRKFVTRSTAQVPIRSRVSLPPPLSPLPQPPPRAPQPSHSTSAPSSQGWGW
jgi:hypothetical protein